MDSLDIDIQGLKDFEKALVGFAKEIGSQKATSALTSSMRKGAKVYEQELKRTAPVSPGGTPRRVKNKKGEKVEILPGFLKSRIKIRASTNNRAKKSKKFGKNVVSVVKVGVYKVPYVSHVEWGTKRNGKNIPSNPFIRKAFESSTKSAVSEIVKESRKKVERIRRKIAKSKK